MPARISSRDRCAIFRSLTTTIWPTTATTPIDVDGDGWIDVISADWMTSPFHWYKNPGEVGLSKGFKWKQHLLKETRGQNEALALRDLDGDGTPEIVVNCWIEQDPLVVWKLVKTDGEEVTLESHRGRCRGRRTWLRLRRCQRGRPRRYLVRHRLVRMS